MFPRDPIAAVTHSDPYDYYEKLVAQKPLYYDDDLKLWVASSAGAVTAVLTNEHCRARPATEPVPKPLLGSAAAEIFRSLVRMNDGAGHKSLKTVVSSTLASIDAVELARLSYEWAQFLLGECGSKITNECLTHIAFHLPVYAIGSLLGVP